jgi:hypothetical protein
VGEIRGWFPCADTARWSTGGGRGGVGRAGIRGTFHRRRGGGVHRGRDPPRCVRRGDAGSGGDGAEGRRERRHGWWWGMGAGGGACAYGVLGFDRRREEGGQERGGFAFRARRRAGNGGRKVLTPRKRSAGAAAGTPCVGRGSRGLWQGRVREGRGMRQGRWMRVGRSGCGRTVHHGWL